jgi:hypothetical protein
MVPGISIKEIDADLMAFSFLKREFYQEKTKGSRQAARSQFGAAPR